MPKVELTQLPGDPQWLSEEDRAQYWEWWGEWEGLEETVLDAALNAPFPGMRRYALRARTAKIIFSDRNADDLAEGERVLINHPGQKPPGMSQRTRELFKQGAARDYLVQFLG